jgi:hypothetical protein
VTIVSMVAPSPDWFVGVSGLSLLEGDDWISERILQLPAWDAGTDSGPSFESPDEDTEPPEPIHLFTTGPLAGTPPMGRFIFTRLDPPSGEALLLRNGRFAVTVEWETPDGASGNGTPLPLTNDTGAFWFFNPANLELLVKVIDACAAFDRYWVFAGGLTNVGVDLRVTDTTTGVEARYSIPIQTPFAPVQDTGAFATCP